MNLDKYLRGRILKTLDFTYPGWVALSIIAGSLNEAGFPTTQDEIRKMLAYLQEKGYAELREVEGERTRIKVFEARCTANGQDLVNGDVEDVGVAI